MRIGVLSDTHLTSHANGLRLFERLAAGPFRDAEMILHAGDLIDPSILDAFPDKIVHAVRGNLDPPDPRLPFKRIVTAGAFRIGLIHGWGAPLGLGERVMREFAEEQLDVLVFGHSHQPHCQPCKGVLLFNPGSATDRRSAPNHTVGLLTLDQSVSARILSVDTLLAPGRT